MTVAAPHWQKGEKGKDSFHANRFVTCDNGDKTYCFVEGLHKLISISQAERRVDIRAAKIDVSLEVMRKKGELGNNRDDKYEQGGAQTMTELLHDRGRDRRPGQGRRRKLGLHGVTFELEGDENGSED
jgi:hypothetical protein